MKKAIGFLIALLLLLPFFPTVSAGEESDSVQYEIPGDRPSAFLLDSDPMTRITVDPNTEIRVTLSSPSNGADWLYLSFYEPPEDCAVSFLSAAGETLLTTKESHPETLYQRLAMPGGCTAISLRGSRAPSWS